MKKLYHYLSSRLSWYYSPMKSKLETAYIGIGSNLSDPERQVCLAAERISAHHSIEKIALSRFYVSSPVAAGGLTQDEADKQPSYVNAVIQVRTSMPARLLLDTLLNMEQEQGRMRIIKGSARTLDLDLLVYGKQEIDEPGLIVPHPRVKERAFVLLPLSDLSPDMTVPGQGELQDLIDKCDKSSIELIKKNCASALVNTTIS